MNSNSCTNIYSDSGNRQVVIEVTGLSGQTMRAKSTQTIKVPYYRLSKTIQQINRLGGKILTITILSSETQTSQSSLITPPNPPNLASADKSRIFSEQTTSPLKANKIGGRTLRIRQRQLRRARIKTKRRRTSGSRKSFLRSRHY